MPVTQNPLTSGSSTTDASSFTTASITPAAEKLVLVAVVNSRTAAEATLPTISGNGLTYVQVATQLYDTIATIDVARITLFRAMGVAPSAGAITIDFGGTSQDGCLWAVSEFGNVDRSGTNGSGAAVQSASNRAVAATSLTVTLAAFANPNNATYGAFAADIDTATTPGGSFTEIHDITQAGGLGEENLSLETEWREDNDTSVDASKGANNDWGGIAVEIRYDRVAFPDNWQPNTNEPYPHKDEVEAY